MAHKASIGHQYEAVSVDGHGQLHQGDRWEADTVATTQNGDIYINAPVTQALKRTPSKLFSVPYRRDPFFIERHAIFAEIDRVEQDSRPAVLYGLGGTGKSQITIEYAYRFRAKFPDSYVFWIFAATQDNVRQSCRELAKQLDLPDSNDLHKDPCSTLFEWLNESDSYNVPDRRWLLILDNVDTLSVLTSSAGMPYTSANPHDKPLLDVLPAQHSPNQRLLVTSRSQDVAMCFDACPIHVDVFEKQQALDLLKSRVPGMYDTSDKVSAEKLVQRLDYLPLAITQAAAYISRNRLTLQQYLAKFEAGDTLMGDYLSTELQDTRRKRGYPNSVYRTWKLSFEEIAEHDSGALTLLSIMSFLNEKQIPRFLFERFPDLLGDESTQAKLEMAFGTIFGYSLASTEERSGYISMHVLVSASIRHLLVEEGVIKEVAAGALTVVGEYHSATYFDDNLNGLFSDWAWWIPHLQSLLSRCPEALPDCKWRLYVWYAISLSEFMNGRLAEALDYIRRAKVEVNAFYAEDPATVLGFASLMANILWRNKMYGEAVDLLEEALKKFEDNSEAQLSQIVSCKTALVNSLLKLDRIFEAQSIAEDLHDRGERDEDLVYDNRLGAFLTSAQISLHKRDYYRAEQAVRSAIQIAKVQGWSDPKLLDLQMQLVTCLSLQLKFEEPTAILEKVFDSYLLRDIPSFPLLMIAGCLPVLLTLNRRYEEALQRWQTILDIERTVLKADHPQLVEHERSLRSLKAEIALTQKTGPLPKGWIVSEREKSPNDICFFDHATRKWTTEDPRHLQNKQEDVLSSHAEPSLSLGKATKDQALGSNKGDAEIQVQQNADTVEHVPATVSVSRAAPVAASHVPTILQIHEQSVHHSHLRTAMTSVQALVRLSSKARLRSRADSAQP